VAVWTGTEMLVWGGTSGTTSVGRYTSATNTWASGVPVVPAARGYHRAVWTGSELIIQGGHDGINLLNTGGRYNPTTDVWTSTATANAPAGSFDPTAIWSGSEMIVWGGRINSVFLNTGARYNPATNVWTPTGITGAPAARNLHTAVWTGQKMIVWGGRTTTSSASVQNTGGQYNPGTDTWTATSTQNAPEGRNNHTAVWTGSEMIVWGGRPASGLLNSGGRYNPIADTWAASSLNNAPEARAEHVAVWTDKEMIIWGGQSSVSSTQLNSGSRYNPLLDTWTSMTLVNAPTARTSTSAIWTRTEMIVWGGFSSFGSFNFVEIATGGRYNPATDIWSATTGVNEPSARILHTVAWTGSEMLLFGGGTSLALFGDTYAYKPPRTMTLYLRP
jgi:hypothetical protein